MIKKIIRWLYWNWAQDAKVKKDNGQDKISAYIRKRLNEECDCISVGEALSGAGEIVSSDDWKEEKYELQRVSKKRKKNCNISR